LAELQSSLATIINHLAYIQKIRKKVKEHDFNLFAWGMAKLDKEDRILSILNSNERHTLSNLHYLGVLDNVDWSSLGLGYNFNNITFSLDSGIINKSSSKAIRSI
ncbi:hypothetical protein BGZ63DRAFT_368747, partial [Mariannaea sp. PMI_226]